MSKLSVNTIAHTGGTTGMTIDSSGVVTEPANPLLKLETTGEYTGQGSPGPYFVQNLTNAVINRGGFTIESTNGGRITIPKTGYYDWKVLTFIDLPTVAVRAFTFEIWKNGSASQTFAHHASPFISATTHDNFTLVDTLSLTADDYLEFKYRIYDNVTNATLGHRMHLRWIP